MGRDLVTNLKFKKTMGQFDPIAFGQMMNEAYTANRNLDRYAKKHTFSPSTVGYGYGMCPRYWFIAFNGCEFEDNFDAIAIANMENGKQAHERIQTLLEGAGLAKELEREILCNDPPIRGFADMIVDWYGTEIIGELKTVRDEVFAARQTSMAPTTSHLIQLLLYMWVENLDEGFLMYENKNTQELLLIPVHMNEKNIAKIDGLFIWLQEVYDNFKDGGLPMRPFKKTSSACKYCPIRKHCWDSEVGEVQIEPYEV